MGDITHNGPMMLSRADTSFISSRLELQRLDEEAEQVVNKIGWQPSLAQCYAWHPESCESGVTRTNRAKFEIEGEHS